MRTYDERLRRDPVYLAIPIALIFSAFICFPIWLALDYFKSTRENPYSMVYPPDYVPPLSDRTAAQTQDAYTLPRYHYRETEAPTFTPSPGRVSKPRSRKPASNLTVRPSKRSLIGLYQSEGVVHYGPIPLDPEQVLYDKDSRGVYDYSDPSYYGWFRKQLGKGWNRQRNHPMSGEARRSKFNSILLDLQKIPYVRQSYVVEAPDVLNLSRMDCANRSVWLAYRLMSEVGVNASLLFGKMSVDDKVGHVWVEINDPQFGNHWIETTIRNSRSPVPVNIVLKTALPYRDYVESARVSYP